MAGFCEEFFGGIFISMGPMGCLLLLITLLEPDWRLLYIKDSTKYMNGYTRVGLWKICFPLTIKGPDNYSIHCCHRFRLLEKFFPVEMNVGRILMPIAFCLAVLGLSFVSLAHEWRRRTPKSARWIFIAGGIFYVISSICIFVPVSWNAHSAAQNKIIPFPSSFHLPTSAAQIKGPAITIGIGSAMYLILSGTYIVGRGIITPDCI